MLDAWLAAVVRIVTGPALCAGVVVEPDGLVATAYHCVASGGRPLVEWRDGRRLVGRVVARDPAHDLALIRVDADGLDALALRSEAPPLGETVYALGHPYGSAASGRMAGVLNWSASRGIVSAVGDWFVQTDAALNPGSSGGPLVDEGGAVIGIASRKLRADNLGLCAKGTDLASLVAQPDAGPWVGGRWGGHVGLVAGEVTWVGGGLWVAARDRAVVHAWLGVTPNATLEPLATLAVDARQAVGRGAWRGVIDAGVGARSAGEPGGYAEVGAAWGPLAVALQTPSLVCPGGCTGRLWTMSLQLSWPGELGVY